LTLLFLLQATEQHCSVSALCVTDGGRRSAYRPQHMPAHTDSGLCGYAAIAAPVCGIMVSSGWRRSSVVRTSVSAGRLSLTCARLWSSGVHLLGKLSTTGPPTRPTHYSIHTKIGK